MKTYNVIVIRQRSSRQAAATAVPRLTCKLSAATTWLARRTHPNSPSLTRIAHPFCFDIPPHPTLWPRHASYGSLLRPLWGQHYQLSSWMWLDRVSGFVMFRFEWIINFERICGIVIPLLLTDFNAELFIY